MCKSYRVREYAYTDTPQVLCQDGTWFKFRTGEVFSEQELYDLACEFEFICFPWGKAGSLSILWEV